MFVLIERGGQWEDSWSQNIMCSVSKIKLERYMINLIEQNKIVNENQEKINDYVYTAMGDYEIKGEDGYSEEDYLYETQIMHDYAINTLGIKPSELELYDTYRNVEYVYYSIQEVAEL